MARAKDEVKLRKKAALKTPSDLSNAAQDIAGALNACLADSFALFLKTKNFHWHVSGPHFRDYHLLLDEQAAQVLAATDDMAERVRKVGGTTIRSIGHIARLQRLSDNDADFVTRAGREMNDLVKASDGKACRAKYDAIASRMAKLQKTPEDMQAKNMGLMALEQGSYCVAAAQGCSAGLELYKKQYAMRLSNMSGVDKIATEAWGTLVQQKRVTCK